MTARTTTMRDDAYPTRRGESRVLPRGDPVIWGRPHATGPDADALASFERDGFLLLRGLLAADEVTRLTAALERTLAGADPERDDVIVEPQSMQVRSVFGVHESVAEFRDLARDPRLLTAAESILDSPVYVHQSRINVKPSFEGAGFAWHSDFETWHAEDGLPRMRALSASVLLTENTPWNGPLLVMPGSHREYVTCPVRTPPDHYRVSLREQRVGVPDHDSLREFYRRGGIEMATGEAGTVVLFDCNLMHASGSNVSPLARSNVFMVFNSVENTPEEPFAAPGRRPAFVSSRDFTPLTPRTHAR